MLKVTHPPTMYDGTTEDVESHEGPCVRGSDEKFVYSILENLGGDGDQNRGQGCLCILFTTSQLRGLPFIIGAEIPPARWTYLEMGMDNETLQACFSTYKIYAGLLGAGVNEMIDSLILNITIYRRLCQAVTNSDLDKFYCNSRGIAPWRRQHVAQ